MAKKQWKSQQVLATELGVTVQVIHNWVKRKDKRINSKKDENTGLTLVCLKNNSIAGSDFHAINKK